ncbi:hypothetical protein M9Y10_002113 [Tritrichomonas musculus]|uniref:Intimal thickness related receptor IRP domain-containing protein n=1 Tax=Tritrichomonas musculus TaxID=1915356 RepID=A0ABR2L9U8_9EUKA
MLIFLFLLSYILTRNIKSSSTVLKIGDFGFEINSTFYVKFTEVGSNSLIYCFFTEEEFSKYPLAQIPISKICHTNSFFPKLRFEISSSKIPFFINGTISNAGVYSQIIANCESSEFLPLPIKLSFTEIFKNPTSTLDSRWKGIKKIKVIIVSIFSLDLLFWFIKLANQPSSLSKLQILLSFTFLSYLFALISRTLEFSQLEYYDKDSGLTIARKIVTFIHVFLLYLSILLISKGWCLIVNRVSAEIFYYVFLILLFDIMLFLIDLTSFSSFNITFIVISVFCASLILHKIIFSLIEVRQYLLSKMISIINTTDCKIAEIKKMRNKYVTLEVSIVLFAFLYLAFTITSIFVKIPFSICEAVYDGLLTSFLIILTILFKNNQFDLNTGYASVTAAFSLTDISPLDNIETSHEVIEDDTIPAATE